ncbi:unnamed protein product [Candida verbasci]|uniref:Uncharacterized protein n=1 Tax=Candida verbasci TaxID=1227364 RepID=A0A9W4TU39_9ASCO|nr:unnamed protein product [Candida verbasci]
MSTLSTLSTPRKRPAEEEEDTTAVLQDPQEIINLVISTLQCPEDKTNVSEIYANDKNSATEVQAYAKIAGKDWTYYVKSLAISIGRNTEISSSSTSGNSIQNNNSQSLIDIDLGPAKVVSRQHANIIYNLDLRCWELKILGRNGARIDGQKVGVNSQEANILHSGAILDIGGTQMMFILPDATPTLSGRILEKALAKFKEKGGNKNVKKQNTNFQIFQSPSAVLANSLQSNLDQDLSKEEAKDIKPPYSYATMITQAILSNPQGVMSLSDIYSWIANHYAYYKYSKSGWQNSIRHNLSLNKAFEKVPRKPNEPGKGMKWQIADSYKEDFLSKINDGSISKTKRGSSVSRQLSLHLATHKMLPESQKNVIQELPISRPQSQSQNRHHHHHLQQQQNSSQLHSQQPPSSSQFIPPQQQQQHHHQQQQSQSQQPYFNHQRSNSKNYALPPNSMPQQQNPLTYMSQNNVYNINSTTPYTTSYQSQPQQPPPQPQSQQQMMYQSQSSDPRTSSRLLESPLRANTQPKLPPLNSANQSSPFKISHSRDNSLSHTNTLEISQLNSLNDTQSTSQNMTPNKNGNGLHLNGKLINQSPWNNYVNFPNGETPTKTK